MLLLNPYRFNRWTPADITTALWLDAADDATITTVSGNVSQWNDKSGNSRHFTQSNASYRPTYDNANDKLVFSASDRMTRTNFMYALGSCEIFIVANLTFAANAAIITEGSTSTINPFYVFSYGSANTDARVYIRNGAAANVFLNAAVYTGWNSGVKAIFYMKDAGNAISAGYNGTVGSAASYTRSGTVSVNTTTIGGLTRTTFGDPCNGDYHEVLVTPVLSTDDRNRVEGYLAHKWGLTANLPADHPYKNIAP